MITPRLLRKARLHRQEDVPASETVPGSGTGPHIPYPRFDASPGEAVGAVRVIGDPLPKERVTPVPQDAYPHSASGTTRPPHSSRLLDPHELLAIVRGKWLVPAIGSFFGLAAALAYFAVTPDLYKSSARILIDKSVNQYLQANTIIREPVIEDVGSQIYIMSSDSVLMPVVRSLKLAEDPEFVGPAKKSENGNSAITRLKQSLKASLGLGSPTTGADMPQEWVAVQSLLGRLSIYREDVPTVINVTFASLDPKKAAEIANAIADTYISTSRDARISSSRTAGKMLEVRLMELKTQLFNVEQKLAAFKEENLIGAADSTISSSEQLKQLQTQLTEARIATGVAKARLKTAERAIEEGTSDKIARDNEIIIKARVQYLELASQVKDLEPRLGPSHIKVAKLRKQMDELQSAIRSEEVRFSATYKNDYEAAQARVAELEAAKANMVEQIDDKGNVGGKLREFETAAETLRGLYNNSLQKYRELPEAVRVEDARIIARASPHVNKSSKKRAALLGGGLLAGFALSVGMLVARELFTGRFRKAAQVRNVLDVPCSVLPLLPVSPAGQSDRLGECLGMPEEWVIQNPYSRFADGIYNIRANLETAKHLNGDKVFGIVSCVSGEGKTTIASNVAAAMVSDSMDARILLIDCDLHRRNLTATLAPDAKRGLMEAMSDPANLGAYVIQRESSGVDILACVLEDRFRDAAKVLGSSEMNRLLSVARAEYDIVLVELPPVMSVVDVKMIERFIDGFVMAIDWGGTKRRMVQEALAELEFLEDRLICTVLNKVEPNALKQIEAYKDPRANAYYLG